MQIKHKSLTGVLILFNLALVMYFILFSRQGFLEGAPAWILAVLGSPVTFIIFFLYRIMPAVFSNITLEYVIISVLFQLQYQVITLVLFYIKSKSAKIALASVFFFAIIISAAIMQLIIMPTPIQFEQSRNLKNKLMGQQ